MPGKPLFYQGDAIVASPDDDTETVIGICDGVSTSYPGQVIKLHGRVNIACETDVTALVVRVRRHSLTGPLVGTAQTVDVGVPGVPGPAGPTGNGYLIATVALNAAAIGSVFSAPTQIVAAPGANKVVVPLQLTVEMVPGVSGGWDMLNPALYYGVAPDAATKATGEVLFSGTGGAVQIHEVTLPVMSAGAIEFASAAVVNKALTFGNFPANPDKLGPALTVTPNDQGLGYAVGDTGTLQAGAFGAAGTYIVATVGALGVVTAVTVTGGGDGHQVGDTLTTATGGGQPGVGTGLTVDVATITNPTGTLHVTLLYTIATTF